MKYEYFNLPEEFNIAISDYDRKTARAFYKWFMSIKDYRISLLEKLLQSTPTHRTWKADFSPDSLDSLHDWFNPRIEQRTITDEEHEIQLIKFEGHRLYEYLKESPKEVWTLSSHTESLSVDIGIYFAELFIRNNPSLYWAQVFTKTSIDCNYPVVKDFNGAYINPFTSIRNMVATQLDGKPVVWSDVYKNKIKYIKNNI